MSKGFRTMIHEQRLLHGLFCFTPSALIVEFIAYAEYDFVIIDLEHSLTNLQTLDHLIVAARSCDIRVLVRVPLERGDLIVPILDAGADGIVFPRISNSEQASQAVQLCRYAPEGNRGLSIHRHLNYQTDNLAERIQQINDEVVVAVMIEDQQGLDNCDDIVGVSGLNIVIEGASDLSASLGVVWQTRHVSVQRGIQKMANAAAASGVYFCAIPRAEEDYTHWRNQGVSLMVLGSDRGVIRKALCTHRKRFIDSCE